MITLAWSKVKFFGERGKIKIYFLVLEYLDVNRQEKNTETLLQPVTYFLGCNKIIFFNLVFLNVVDLFVL